jgi:hypothetical protein
VYEEARGGEHAAWERTIDEMGDTLLRHGVKMIQDGIR